MTERKHHVMVDIETLGTRPGAVILSIGAVAFDESGLGSEFHQPIDLFTSLMLGLDVDQKTIEWWRKQSDPARGRVVNGTVGLQVALMRFAFWLDQAAYVPPRVWAKGPDFDLVLLDAAYRVAGLNKPWGYNRTRDVRTITALARVQPAVATLEHDALADAIAQAETVRAAAVKLGVKLSEGF